MFNPTKLLITLDSEVSYTFKNKVSKKTFGKQEIDQRITSFINLNRETGNPIFHGKEVSGMLGANLFTWLRGFCQTQEQIKIEFTKRVIGLVQDLKTQFQGTVSFSGENVNFLDMELLKQANLSFKIIHQCLSSETTIELLEQKLGSISQRIPIDGVSYFDSANHHVVFTLENQKGLIFKLILNGNENALNGYMDNCSKAQKACLDHNLDLIVIPKTEKLAIIINGKRYLLLVAEKVNANTDEKAQLYKNTKVAPYLKEAVIQLVTFIYATSYNDLTPRNIFVLKKNKDDHRRRLAVIDLDQFWSYEIGLLGRHKNEEWGDSGLLNMVSLDLVDPVINEARKLLGSAFTQEMEQDAQLKKDERYQHEKGLQQFYEDKGIITGREVIKADLEKLFSDPEDFEIASILIDAINEQIAKNKAMPPQFIRRINFSKKALPNSLIPSQIQNKWESLFDTSSENGRCKLECMIDKLVKEKVIYRKIPGYLNYGLNLQA